jgi:hypothetical protein
MARNNSGTHRNNISQTPRKQDLKSGRKSEWRTILTRPEHALNSFTRRICSSIQVVLYDGQEGAAFQGEYMSFEGFILV